MIPYLWVNISNGGRCLDFEVRITKLDFDQIVAQIIKFGIFEQED